MSTENKIGRQRAANLIQDCAATDDLPRLVREVRHMATAQDDISVGFLFEIADRLTAGASFAKLGGKLA